MKFPQWLLVIHDVHPYLLTNWGSLFLFSEKSFQNAGLACDGTKVVRGEESELNIAIQLWEVFQLLLSLWTLEPKMDGLMFLRVLGSRKPAFRDHSTWASFYIRLQIISTFFESPSHRKTRNLSLLCSVTQIGGIFIDKEKEKKQGGRSKGRECIESAAALLGNMVETEAWDLLVSLSSSLMWIC